MSFLSILSTYFVFVTKVIKKLTSYVFINLSLSSYNLGVLNWSVSFFNALLG